MRPPKHVPTLPPARTPGGKAAVTALAGGLALAIALTACGGGTKAAGSTTTTTPGATGGFGGQGTGAFPGAFGSVAAISGSSMEVQSQQSGQETVTWTTSTQFSRTATVALSSISVGSCITATGTDTNGAIAATSISITQPTSGSCTTGLRTGRPSGSGGFRPGAGSGTGSTPPRSFPGRAPNFGFATGKVTSVGSNEIVLTGIESSGFSRSATSSTTVPKATTVHVTVTGSTTFIETETATAANLAVGDCVTAAGSSNSTGAVAATTVRITSTGGQSCTFGGGAFGGGGFFGGGGGTGSTGGGAQ